MKKLKKTIVTTFLILSSFVLGTSTASAFELIFNGGFSPVPTTIHCNMNLDYYSKIAVSNACSTWNAAGAGNLISKGSDIYTQLYPYENGSNEITKGDRGTTEYVAQMNPTATAGHWFTTSYITESDIDINVSHPFSNSGGPNSYDVQNIITHEIGHLLGLDDLWGNTNIIDNTMYGSANLGETKKRTLEQDDKNGIIYIYN